MADYEQMEIDITLESDRDLKENMQATAKFALGQIMEYQHPTKVKNRHEGYGIAAEGYASLQGKMKSTKTDMDDLLKLLPNGDGDVLNVIGSLYNSAVEVAVDGVHQTGSTGTEDHGRPLLRRKRKADTDGRISGRAGSRRVRGRWLRGSKQ